MSNKGFTLTELLAIVVILSIIVVLAAPAISKEVKKSDDETQNIVNEKIENAAHLYIAKYYADAIVSVSSGTHTIQISLDDLQKDGLLELKDDVCKEKKDAKIIVNYGSEVSYNYSNVEASDCYIKKTN